MAIPSPTGNTNQKYSVDFDDAPDKDHLEKVISAWHRPEPPGGLENITSAFSDNGDAATRHRLYEIRSSHYKSQLEAKAISWLYDFIRANVKRGRVFDLSEVLQKSYADCLGYAKLFTALGRRLGLDVGVVEVVIDNNGRFVPHTSVLVRLDNHQLRFVDLWYGAKNIKHKRVGLQVKRGGVWQITDLELAELKRSKEACYLPDTCVNAITFYIRGNRHLGNKEFNSAISCYSKAIELYPDNARFFYNRAVAQDNLGEYEKAYADYAQALSGEAAIIRILAREYDEVTSLINLDAHDIDNLPQEMYLLYKGFITGKAVQLSRVAKKFGLSIAGTAAILRLTEAKIKNGPGVRQLSE